MVPQTAALEEARSILEAAIGESAIVSTLTSGRVVRVGKRAFLIAIKPDGKTASLESAFLHLKSAGETDSNLIPLIVVPAMGRNGARLCEEAHVNWLDLHGNASIKNGELRILIAGRHNPNIQANASVGFNPFSRKASRVAHAFLSDPSASWTRNTLQNVTKLDKGFVSKTIAELRKNGYITENGPVRSRHIHVQKPMALLDDWDERYEAIPTEGYGLVAARDGFEAVKHVAKLLDSTLSPYAISGMPAAAAYTHFGGFRRIDVYLSQPPPSGVLNDLHISMNASGRNVALHLDDFRVSLAMRTQQGISYADAVSTYLDLKHLSERSEEAREKMRRYLEERWSQ